MNFQEVAKAAFPNEPHMQDCIEPNWIARCIKEDMKTEKPSPDSISVEFVSEGIVSVLVNGVKVGEYKPTFVNGEYVGHTIQ